MKNLFFIIAAVLMAASCSGQSKGKVMLYGYVQSVAGNRHSDLAEDGTTKETIRTGKNYLLYASAPARIYPMEIWIEGVKYGVTIKSISKTPVIFKDETNIGSLEQTLVHATKEKVIQLIPNSQPTKSLGSTAQALAKSNALVLVFKQSGKLYYNTLKSLNELSAAALQ